LADADGRPHMLRFFARPPAQPRITFTDLSEPENDWLERFVTAPETASDNADAAKLLVGAFWKNFHRRRGS